MAVQISFVGGSKEAFLSSTLRISGEVDRTIVFYSEKTEKIYKESKGLLPLRIEEEIKMDFNSINDIKKKLGNKLNELMRKGEPVIVNATGASKEVLLFIFTRLLLVLLSGENPSWNVSVKTLTLSNQLISIPFHTIVSRACKRYELKRRDGLRKKILDIVEKEGSIELSDLAKRLKIAKPTVSRAITTLEKMELVTKRRVGRKLTIQKAPFATGLMKEIYEGEKNNGSA